jgi:hypothetical protein
MDREGMDTKRVLSSKHTISYKQQGMEAGYSLVEEIDDYVYS